MEKKKKRKKADSGFCSCRCYYSCETRWANPISETILNIYMSMCVCICWKTELGIFFLENKSVACFCIKQPVSRLCILIQYSAMEGSRCFNGLLQTFILNPLKVPNYAKLASPLFCSNNHNLRAERPRNGKVQPPSLACSKNRFSLCDVTSVAPPASSPLSIAASTSPKCA